MTREAATARTFYSRSGYGSTASESTETTSSGQLSSMLPKSPPRMSTSARREAQGGERHPTELISRPREIGLG
jgi:hypothetical protein